MSLFLPWNLLIHIARALIMAARKHFGHYMDTKGNELLTQGPTDKYSLFHKRHVGPQELIPFESGLR